MVAPRRVVFGLLAGSLVIAGSLLPGACARQGGRASAPSAPVREDSAGLLAAWLSGSFSSHEQSMADPSYFDIQLHMTPIWTDRTDGPWLYVEQARADTPGKPYRQRVYHVLEPKAPETRYASEVYTLPEPVTRFVGSWQDPAGAAISATRPEDLKKLEGCTVWLAWQPELRAFVGGTEGTGCISTRDGARYTSSEIELTDGLLSSWDRGLDENGKQAWGATKGGYRFVREP